MGEAEQCKGVNETGSEGVNEAEGNRGVSEAESDVGEPGRGRDRVSKRGRKVRQAVREAG